MNLRPRRRSAGLAATAALSLLLLAPVAPLLWPRRLPPLWREVAFRLHPRDEGAGAAHVERPPAGRAPGAASPADPLAFVPRGAFRLEKERVTAPLRRPSAVLPGLAAPAAGDAAAGPGVPLLAPPPLPTAGSVVDGRPVERARTLESRRGGFSALVAPAK